MTWRPSYQERIIGLRHYAEGTKCRLMRHWTLHKRRWPMFRISDWGCALVAATQTPRFPRPPRRRYIRDAKRRLRFSNSMSSYS
jgi:hypothetical protein